MRSTRASGNAAHSRAAWSAERRGALAAARRTAGPRSGCRARRAPRRRRGRGPPRPPASVDQVVDHATGRREVGEALVRRRGLARAGAAGSARRRAPGGRPRPRRGSRGPWPPGPGRAAIALAHSTASQPSSIASAASRRRADAGVEDHRHAGALDDEREVVRVADAHARADRRAERHDRGAADVLQAAREDRVVGRVGQHDEAVGDELLGGEQQLRRVGQQRALVADDLELDPVGRERLARQLRGERRRRGR